MNYRKNYENLIQRAKDRILDRKEYTETHHIVPKCIGGSNDAENLVELLPEEHLVAHLLLVKMHPGNTRLIYAANWMTNRVKNNKEYGWVKREFSKIESLKKTGKKRSIESVEKQRDTISKKYKNGYVSPIKGQVLTSSHKQAISEGNKGKEIPVSARSNLEGYILRYGEVEGPIRYQIDSQKKRSNSLDSYIKKYGNQLGTEKYQIRCSLLSNKMTGEKNHFYGMTHTEETRKKISESNIGKSKVRTPEHNQKIGFAQKGKKHEVVQCPHCKKQGGKITMKQWHFDNCKLHPNGPLSVRKSQPMITCPHCGKTGNGPRMKSDHFDRCKKFRNI